MTIRPRDQFGLGMEYGHIHALRWLSSLWDDKIYLIDPHKFKMEHPEVQDWFLNSISEKTMCDLIVEIYTSNDFEVLYWLHKHAKLGPIITKLLIRLNLIEDIVIYGNDSLTSRV
jgi:hypothetical protein